MSVVTSIRRTFFTTLGTFLVSFGAGWWILSGPAKTTWEPIIASIVLAGVFAFFIFLVNLFPRFILGSWLAFAGFLFVLSFFTNGNVELGYFGSNTSSGGCITEDYCTDSLLFNIVLEATMFINIIVGATLGVFYGKRYIERVPQARYYLGAGIFFFFAALMSAVYFAIDYTPALPQYILLSFYSLMGIACIVIGKQYARLSVQTQKLQKVFSALLVSSLFLLPFLIPFEEKDLEDATLGYIIFGCFAVFTFFALLFSKPRPTKTT